MSNSSLVDLDGLSQLENVISDIQIVDNVNLSDFCGLNNLLINGSFSGNYFTNENAYNPTYQDMLDGNCSQ